MTYKEKGVYLGYWENGQRHGEGVFTYPNKDTYSGWWKYGKKEGPGTYTFSETGMKFVGTWTGSEFARGKWVFPNGTYFEGEFSKNQPKGKGKWVVAHKGNVATGEYTQAVVEEETPEGDKKTKIKVSWKSDANIIDSSEKVNTGEEI